MFPDESDEFTKSQFLRTWDVLFLGPFMIWTGAYRSGLPDLARGGLILSGILTILYNGKNWIANRELELKRGEREKTALFGDYLHSSGRPIPLPPMPWKP